MNKNPLKFDINNAIILRITDDEVFAFDFDNMTQIGIYRDNDPNNSTIWKVFPPASKDEPDNWSWSGCHEKYPVHSYSNYIDTRRISSAYARYCLEKIVLEDGKK